MNERRGFACVGLNNPKNSINVGAVLRAVNVFGGKMLVTQGVRYRKVPTDTMSTHKKIPMIQVADLKDAIPYGCVPVAIELIPSAQPLTTYKHPERAFYIFGAEDSTLGDRVLSWCRDVVYIPAGCLNLAACVNVVLYDRLLKGGAK